MAVRLRSQDVGWLYGRSVGKRRHHVKCIFCDTVFRGGITRFKRHFVGKVVGIGPCASAPEEVREMILSEAERKRSSRAASGKLDACNKRTGKIRTGLAMTEDFRKRNSSDSKQQKMLTTCGSVQSEPASDTRSCIPSEELGSGKRKHIDSGQQKKIRSSGNLEIDCEPQKKCIVSKEGTRERKDMDSKQQKKRQNSKEDTLQSFYDNSFPRYAQAKKLSGIKEISIKSEEQKKLDTNAFESFLEYMWSKLSDVKRNTCTYLDCLWFSLYMRGPSRSKVLTWIKKKRIFSRKYVFVPIICWGHWSLLILCHFGESFMSKAKRPCMLLLDSLGNINPMRLEPDIRRFVFDIYKSEGCEDEKSIQKIPLLIPKVPQQRDGKKCGIFALYFIRLFLQDAPEAFNQEGYPYFLTENWFSTEDVENFDQEVLHFTSHTVLDDLEENVEHDG